MQNEQGIAEKYQKIPVGLAFKLVKGNEIYKTNPDNLKLDKFIVSVKDKDYYQKKTIKELFSGSLVNMGRYALITKDSVNAKKAFQKAIKVNPNDTLANEGLELLR